MRSGFYIRYAAGGFTWGQVWWLAAVSQKLQKAFGSPFRLGVGGFWSLTTLIHNFASHACMHASHRNRSGWFWLDDDGFVPQFSRRVWWVWVEDVRRPQRCCCNHIFKWRCWLDRVEQSHFLEKMLRNGRGPPWSIHRVAGCAELVGNCEKSTIHSHH